MAEPKAKITFRVRAPKRQGGPVFLTGNRPELGNWNPAAVALEPAGDGTWSKTLTFPKAAAVAFKFTRGSWDTEEVRRNGASRGNRYVKAHQDQTLEIRIANWRDLRHRVEGGVTGTVRYHEAFPSRYLRRPRTLAVWLPPGYQSHTGARYPVLYAHDGQNLFDPRTAFAGVEWQLDETADRLIRQKRIQPIIMVGIYNTPDRLREYADTPLGRRYMRFIIEEVKPYIDAHYRTLPQREHTAVMGSSMGGLISLYLLWRYPEVFSKAACLSSTLGWRRAAVLRLIEQDPSPPRGFRLYIDHGALGEEGACAADFHRLVEILQRKGFHRGVDVQAIFDRRGDHSERAWARRVWRPLSFLFGIKAVSQQ